MQRHPFKQQITAPGFPARGRERGDPRSRAAALPQPARSRRPARPRAWSISHELNEVEISCLPKDLPEFIEIDLGELETSATSSTSPTSSCRAAWRLPELKLGQGTDDRRASWIAAPRRSSKPTRKPSPGAAAPPPAEVPQLHQGSSQEGRDK